MDESSALSQSFDPRNNRNYRGLMLIIALAALILGFLIYSLFRNSGIYIYKDLDTAISFEYSKDFFVLQYDEDGSKMLPNIFFEDYKYPSGYSRNHCPVDCINISAFIRPARIGLPHWDIPLQVEKNNPEFPIYDYPRYVHKDETGSKSFQINGMEAVRYYAAGSSDAYVNAYATDKNAPVEYTLEDRVFIKDPSLPERIIYIVYQENINTLPAEAESLDALTIKSLFDPKKYGEFQNILASVRVLPTDRQKPVTQTSEELGIYFETPVQWGNLIEFVSEDREYGSSGISLTFKSPLFSWEDPSPIEFEAHNSETSRYAYEGPSPLYQYSGEALDSACQKNAYLDDSGTYDIKMTECNLRTLTSGMKIVVFKGEFAQKYEYGEGEITADKMQFVPFKGAILKTGHSKWPGMTIHFEGQNIDFDSAEKTFDKIIDSLSYTESSINLGGGYYKDKVGIYFQEGNFGPFRMDNVDLATFVVIDPLWQVAKDNKNVYNWNLILTDADVTTFQRMKNDESTFFKDRLKVWYPYTGHGNLAVIKEADAETFTLVPIQPDGTRAYDASYNYAVSAKGFLVVTAK